MKIFLYCFISFAIAWLIHFFVWRIRQPKKHTRALLLIFMGTLIIILTAGLTSVFPKLSWLQGLHLMIFYIPTTLAYICFYSAIEEDSPSVGLIKLTADKKICKFEDYYSVINDQVITNSRLSAMVRDKLLFQSNDEFQLTIKGRRLAKLFSATHEFFQLKNAG